MSEPLDVPLVEAARHCEGELRLLQRGLDVCASAHRIELALREVVANDPQYAQAQSQAAEIRELISTTKRALLEWSGKTVTMLWR